MKKSFLILSSSGGGGHLTIAKGERDHLLYTQRAKSTAAIEIIDIMGVDTTICTNSAETWVPHYGMPKTDVAFFSGKSNVAHWNNSQKMGGMESVRRLEGLVNFQSIAESIQAKTLYQKLTAFLIDNPDLEEVIDTQALSTPVICRAITEENQRRFNSNRPALRMRKIISEFITDKTVHYMASLSRVKPEHAKCLTVEIANSPLRPNHESEADFYKRNKVDHVHFKQKAAPLRAEFRNPIYGQERTVYIKAASDTNIPGPLKEQDYIHDTLGEQGVFESGHFKLQKQAQDKFFTISLGSQSSMAILSYIDEFIEQVLASTIAPDQKVVFFVAAGKNTGTSDTVYALAREHLEKRMAELKTLGVTWPQQAKIVPLSFQDDKCMSSLFQNSDVLITRTGGMSSIEANESQSLNPQRRVCLHSEVTPPLADVFPKQHADACYQTLMPGTVRWEGGNAQYLMQSINATLTTPHTILFNIDNKTTLPQFKGSIVQMASAGTLNKAYLESIIHCFNHGSDPNVDAFGGLPALAFAKDMETLTVCMQYGGRLNKAVINYLLKHGRTPTEIETLKAFQALTSKEIRSQLAPKKLHDQFVKAINEGDLGIVKGALYRYPGLAHSKATKDLATENSAVKSVIDRFKSRTKLHVAMQNPSPDSDSKKKALIYFQQAALNIQRPKNVTPLTLCKDPVLREFMVQLGANPGYLSKDVSVAERKALRIIYTKREQQAKQLKKMILSAYSKHGVDEELFSSRLAMQFKSHAWAVNPDHLKTMAQVAFKEIKLAKHDIARMNVIDKLINFFLQLFASDVTNKRLNAQSKFLLFSMSSVDGVSTQNKPSPCFQ